MSSESVTSKTVNDEELEKNTPLSDEELEKDTPLSDEEISRLIKASRETSFKRKEIKKEMSEAFKKVLTTVDIIRLDEASEIFPSYKKALTREDGKSTILVEYGDYYNEK